MTGTARPPRLPHPAGERNDRVPPRRTAVVSGSSSGIGRATARALANDGYRVFAGVRDAADAPRTETGARGTIEPLVLDVTDDESVTRAARWVAADLGGEPLAALVNNAGIGRLAPMAHVPLADLQAVWDVNVMGAVRLTQAMLPMMSNGSRLVFVSSVGDRITMPFGGPLNASKSALTSIAEALRLELRARGIQVSILEPGSINTSAIAKVEAGVAETAARVSRSDAPAASRFRTAAAVALRHERAGSRPEVVARAIVHTLDARRPPSRVLVGKGARLLAVLAAVLPDRLLDAVRLRLFRQPTGPVPGPLADIP